MQPANRKLTRSRTGIARARMLLKQHVAWLPGYPLRVETGNIVWRSFPHDAVGEPRVWQIDSDELSRAQKAISQLRHQYARALRRIVGDVDRWLWRMDFTLQMLKSALRGDGFPRSAALVEHAFPRRCLREFNDLYRTRELRPFLDALATFWITDRQEVLLQDFNWIHDASGMLTMMHGNADGKTIGRQVLFYSLRNRIPHSLLNCLCWTYSEELLRDCPLTNFKEENASLRREVVELCKGRDRRQRKARLRKQAHTLGDLLDTVLVHTMSLQPKVQVKMFSQLDQVITPSLLDRVLHIRRKITDERASFNRWRNQLLAPYSNSLVARRRQISEALDSDSVADSELDLLKDFVFVWYHIREKASDPLMVRDAIYRVLGTLPDKASDIRLGLLRRWLSAAKKRERSTVCRFIRVLDGISKVFARRGVPNFVIDLWRTYVRSDQRDDFIWQFVEDLESKRGIDATISLFEQVVCSSGKLTKIGPKLLGSLSEFAESTSDAQTAAVVVRHLASRTDEYWYAKDVRSAFVFGNTPEEVVAIICVCQENCDLGEIADRVAKHRRNGKLRDIVGKRILVNDAKTLSILAALGDTLLAFDKPIPELPPIAYNRSWIGKYPKALHQALLELADTTTTAQMIAQRILRKNFPTPDSYQSQIRALQNQLRTPTSDVEKRARLEGRLRNLRNRLQYQTTTSSNAVSPARLENLSRKIQQRAEHEILQRAIHTFREAVGDAVRERYGTDNVSEESFSPTFSQVMCGLMENVPKSMRDLGLKLWFATQDRSTRGFDEAPANVDFRKCVESLGINLQPWLDDSIEVHAKTAAGESYRLAFTRDVVDFLLMGFHFRTCLSPDSMNFFSTLTNAVDINKRLVYGKTTQGKVIGRCLFALNDRGEILTFQRYAHNRNDGFAEAVDQFLEKLATAMQTKVTSRGKIPALVAQQWYDDGPVGSTQQQRNEIACDLSALLAKLFKQHYSSEVLAELRRHIGRAEILRRILEICTQETAKTLPIFLNDILDEFETELSSRQTVAIAFGVTSETVTCRLLRRVRYQELVRILRSAQCNECSCFHGVGSYEEVFQKLADVQPSLALRVIRATRNPRRRDDDQEANSARRSALARVHRLLGRERLADALSSERPPRQERRSVGMPLL